MQIAVEITIFGHRFSDVVDFPGEPTGQAEVIAWLMTQTDFKWVNYESAPWDDKMLYQYQDGTTQ